uniref:Carboxylic ester hydrolase n=1 Tax=Oncocephalus sp. TaxID=2944721 RepID=A0AB38ZEG3_9HEMI
MISLYVIIKLLFLIKFIEGNQLIVDTTNGKLEGREFPSNNGRICYAFNGIPYAKPPTGELRFKDPQPADSWSGVRGAYSFGSACVQLLYLYPPVETTMLGNEDCLYLSVYTPNTKPSNPYPTMVYMHGGAFGAGSGEIDKSPEYFLDHDMVLVLINYRLGPLGFLSTEDNEIKGNMGLKDQALALRWVKDNIANFGGDPNKVTIFGESAGSVSVHYHMLSPMSRGLFHRAISQSGTAVSPWGYVPLGVARSRAVKMANLFNCPAETSQQIAQCLRKQNAYDIVKSIRYFPISQIDPSIVFTPTIDVNSSNPFLPVNPNEAEPAPVPWMVGCDSLEGIIRSGVFLRFPVFLDDFDKNFNRAAPPAMFYDHTANKPDEMTNKIRKFYFGDQSITLSLFQNLTDMFSDSYMLWPTMKALKKHKGSNYFYYFDYEGQTTLQEVFSTKKVLKGASHSEEILYLWKINNPFELPSPTTESDIKMTKLLLKLIHNFALSGNPTPPDFEFNWPLWNDEEQKFITIGNSGVMQEQYFQSERMKFWEKLEREDKSIIA